VKLKLASALLEGFGGELVIIAPFEGAAVPVDGKSRIKEKRRRPVTRKSIFLSLATFVNEVVDFGVVSDRVSLLTNSMSPPFILIMEICLVCLIKEIVKNSIESLILFYEKHRKKMFPTEMIDDATLKVYAQRE
jgi:hypothetical protein